MAVVSIPSRLIFEERDAAYKKSVIGGTHALVARKCCRTRLGRCIGFQRRVIGMRSFGASGKIRDAYKKFDIATEGAVVRSAHKTFG
jgi:transketolase